MPLYIDLHIDNNLTPELIRKCHVADKAIQDKYGVRYLQILHNQPQGYLFCLCEGPDKESCARVHSEAHGSIACNILEITESDFGALLAGKNKDGFDFTLNPDGTVDTGNRAIMTINILGSPEKLFDAKEAISNVLVNNNGRRADSFGDALTALFDSVTPAVTAALEIRKTILEKEIPVEVRTGITFGPPLEEKGNLFEDVCRSSFRFAFMADNFGLNIDTKVKDLYKGNGVLNQDNVRVLNSVEDKFLNKLMDAVEKIWKIGDVSVSDLASELAMSKSQLTRKLQTLFNISPNDFIKEFRLRNAMRLIQDHNMNVAEVTMAIGFSNPSYFTKCFRERFGIAPSSL